MMAALSPAIGTVITQAIRILLTTDQLTAFLPRVAPGPMLAEVMV